MQMDNIEAFWQHARLVTSKSNVPYDSSTQFGGTWCNKGATRKWSGRILQQGMDLHGFGRWSFVRIHGNNGRKVLVVTIYQASCKASIRTIGSKTAFRQEGHLIRQSGDTKLDPQKRFINNLDVFLPCITASHCCRKWNTPHEGLQWKSRRLIQGLEDSIVNK